MQTYYLQRLLYMTWPEIIMYFYWAHSCSWRYPIKLGTPNLKYMFVTQLPFSTMRDGSSCCLPFICSYHAWFSFHKGFNFNSNPCTLPSIVHNPPLKPHCAIDLHHTHLLSFYKRWTDIPLYLSLFCGGTRYPFPPISLLLFIRPHVFKLLLLISV